MGDKYLFVSGSPCSGTTVLAHILNWSDSVFVGLERYGSRLLEHPETFTPELFTAQRLSRFEPGDCTYPDYASKPGYQRWHANPKDAGRADGMTYVGDKVPALPQYLEVFRRPAWVGRDVTLLVILRNVADVAACYQKRKLKQSVRWDHDYLQAIAAWSETVDCAHALASGALPNVRLGIVDYDRIFGRDLERLLDSAKAIYGFLGEAFGAKQVVGMGRVYQSFLERKGQRNQDDIRKQVQGRVCPETLACYRRLLETDLAPK
jgi:hypothetical protein